MNGFDRATLTSEWVQAMAAGTFLTPKHDPSCVSATTYSSFRSVLSFEAASRLEDFLRSGHYSISQYQNQNPLHGGYQYVLRPSDKNFVVGSGVPPMASVPHGTCDAFVVVSGQQMGWHIYADQLSTIQQRVAAGSRKLVTTI